MESRPQGGGTGKSRDQVLSQERVTVELRIDEATMALLLRERDTMEDEAVEVTIRRRLTKGLLFAIVLGPAELKWRPVHRDSMTLTVDLKNRGAWTPVRRWDQRRAAFVDLTASGHGVVE